jgi:tetratricopeptide (TPR) repeat protein
MILAGPRFYLQEKLTMTTLKSSVFLALFLSVAGCASMRVSSDVTAGRQAYLRGNNETALSYFQSAAQTNPNYVYGTALKQGIWSYVGRTEYATGQLPQARQTLTRALQQNSNEDLARLYLGLTLAQQGDRQTGLREIEGGMKGIYNWLEYVTHEHSFSFGRFWDPTNEIRSSIQGDLAMISGRDLDWTKLISNAEWIGKRMEEESDQARQDETRELNRQSESRDGQP